MRSSASVAVAALVVPVLWAQTPARPQDSQPIRVDTSLVRVDVYPTRDGRVVPGLQAADFEILEDGVPQKVETFEHVALESRLTTASDPGSQREMERALGNPRHRVFLIFLDAPHVTLENGHAINAPLVEFMERYVANDDLVALMTPAMDVRTLAFGRKTEVWKASLKERWNWGIKERLAPELDEREIQYEMCYPVTVAGDVAAKMIARKRERATLEALEDAVNFLQSVREERKAIVTVSEGWVLFREDRDLMNRREKERPLGIDKLTVGRGGNITTNDDRNRVNVAPQSLCESDRMRLSQIDNAQFLLDLIDRANRSNAAFYTIHPGGLTVSRSDRNGALASLASGTDGLNIINSNDLEKGLKRIADDMSSYYLLGYYPSNAKPDGRFRSITVRVKQPNVQVRARKGYRAPTEEELVKARRVTAAADVARPDGVGRALDRLGRLRPDGRFLINAAASVSGPGAIWVAGEALSPNGPPDEFSQGATAFVEVTGTGVSASSKVVLKPGERTFLVRLELPGGAAGTVDVRAQLSSEAAGTLPLRDTLRLSIGEPEPLLFRRGVTTGNRLLPAADLRFSRTERMRLEIPAGPGPGVGKAVNGRVLDRGGAATQVPVRLGERTDEGTGQRWITADITLGPLSPADYVVEIVLDRDGVEKKVLTPVRVSR